MRSRRRVLLMAGLAWTLLLPSFSCLLLGSREPVRDVILITIDTFRADRLALYGGRRIQTPFIDALARDGVVFDNAYSTVPLTAPAHSSIMTGRYPITHGVKLNGSSILSQDETTLAEIAAERGMGTAAIVSCLVLASRFGINQGFDLYYEEGITGEEGQRGLWYDERKAALSIDRALRWLRAESDRPFFLWLHLFDPHHPYNPPPPFAGNYRNRPYDGEIVYTDRALGRFFRELKEMGLYEEALIILAGDHGESLGDHLERFHGTFLYDATMHIPLIIKTPGGRRGARVRGVASILDIMPTVVDALGEEIPEGTQGISLLPAVRGEGSIPDRTLYLESIYPNATFGWAEVRAIRTPHMKYVDLPTPELYDLADDPDEMDNLHEQAPYLAREAREEYGELTEALEQSARKDADAAELDEEFRDRLLSLGYIAGTESALVREGARDPKEVVLLTQPVTNARGLVKDRKFDEAIELLTRAVDTDPENKMALVTLGRAYTGARRIEEAKEVFRTAIEIYPDSEEVYRLLGWILIREQDYQGAEELMARLIHNSPRSAQAHYLYGFAYFRDRKWDKALAALSEAASLSRSYPKTHYLMAVCYEQTGRRAEALEALDNYLKREPDVESLFRDPYFRDLKTTPEFVRMIRRYL